MLPTVPDLRLKERKNKQEEDGKCKKKHGKKWPYTLHFPQSLQERQSYLFLTQTIHELLYESLN